MKRIISFAVAILACPLLGFSAVGFSQTTASDQVVVQTPSSDEVVGKKSVAQTVAQAGRNANAAKPDNRPDNRVGKHKPGNNPDVKNGKNHRKPNPNPNWDGEGASDHRVVGGPRFDPRTPVRRTFQNFQFLQENDPELYKLIQSDIEFEKTLRELAKKYKIAKDDKQKEKIRKDIAEQTEKHFWVRQQKRELELERMKAWLEQLEGQVKKSRENSQFIIERRINQLLGNDLGEF